MASIFAYVALLGWPVVVIFLFRLLPQAQAVAWSVIGGYLALPYAAGWYVPMLPAFDKTFIPAAMAGIMVLVGGGLPDVPATRHRRSGRSTSRGTDAPPAPAGTDAETGGREMTRPSAFTRQPAFTRQRQRHTGRAIPETHTAEPQTAQSHIAEAHALDIPGDPPAALAPVAGPVPRIVILLLVLLIATPFLTSATNTDPYRVGVLTRPGLGLYDAFSGLKGTMVMLLPFFLGLSCLGAPDRQPALLRIFVLAGLIYTLPTLFEIRFSPQLSRWFYGFLAQDFLQAMRDGGFRPVVFLQHGLWLAIFLATVALAAFALWRHERTIEFLGRARDGVRQTGGRISGRWLLAGLWVTGVLALCHSLGALAILVMLMPIALFASLRVQMLVAVCITLVILSYPMLRGSGLIPARALENMAQGISADRGGSLKLRLDNEEQLLAHANERPLAGWGGFGRSLIFDPVTGKDLSITDGIWIIVMGGSGWVGYLATFGLLTMPMLILFWRQKQLDISFATAGLCLMMTANLIDMIPNATMTPLTWLMAGALAGRCRFAARTADSAAEGPLPRGANPQRIHRRPGASRTAVLRRLSGSVLAGALAMGLLMGSGPAARAEGAIPSDVGVTDPTLAFGLSGISDWSTEMPFLDLMKTARPFIGHKGDKWDAMSHADLVTGGYLDAQGWPKAIPPGMTSVGTIWAWDASSGVAAQSRRGVYVLTYEGEGTLQLAGDVKILQSRPGRILLRNVQGSAMGLNITATDPGHDGNYLRDIVIVRAEYEALHDAGEIFNPDFLAIVQDARELRFMDWMGTNGVTQATWDTRPKPDDATWASGGVPVEVMVQLANQTGTEPWFNMPAGADDSYIRNFATYVRDHLNPALKVHVEYSNELWNWMFPQTQWLPHQAKAVWGTDDKAAYIDYAAMLATKSALIWDGVFGAAARTRLDKVVAGQTVNTWLSTRLLTAPLWQEFDPAGYVAPAKVFTSLAVTSYFGYSQIPNPKERATLLAMLKDPSQDATGWLKSRMMDPEVESSIPQVANYLADQKAVARQYGLKLVLYEGGQHLLHSAGVGGLNDADMTVLTKFMAGFVRGPAMADLYRQLWTVWARIGDGPFMQFVDVGSASKFGAWGLFSALGDRTSRGDFLMDMNTHAEAWFGTGGGPEYRQGVILIGKSGGEAFTGTDRDDFLIGGAGDDTFTPGSGHDVISGGGGHDTVALPGAAKDWHLAAVAGKAGTGSGVARTYRLTGPGTEDILYDISFFRFADGTTKTSGDMLKP